MYYTLLWLILNKVYSMIYSTIDDWIFFAIEIDMTFLASSAHFLSDLRIFFLYTL